MFIDSLCSLYSWRYDRLGNLPHVLAQTEFKLANPGFAYDYQLIDVGDFNGVGESEPNPYFYQVNRDNRQLPVLCINESSIILVFKDL